MEIYILSGLSLFILSELKCLRVALLFYLKNIVIYSNIGYYNLQMHNLKNILKTNLNYFCYKH